KTTSVTAAAVAALAEIGSSPAFKKKFASAAGTYITRARQGWHFLAVEINNHGKRDSYQTLYNYGDIFMHNDELVWAAAAMYAAGLTEPSFDPRTLLMAWLPDP